MSRVTWMKRAAALSILPIAAFGMVGCEEEEPIDDGIVEEEPLEEEEEL